MQEVLEKLPVVDLYMVLGQPRKLEVEEVPGPPQLAGVPQPLVELARMGRIEDGEPVDDLGMVHRERPGGGSAPVVADHQRGLGTALLDETADVIGQVGGAVGVDAVRLGRQVVPPQVGRDDPEARCRERRDLQSPAVPELREAVQQNDQRTCTGLDVMQVHIADFRVTLPKLDTDVREHAGGHEDLRG